MKIELDICDREFNKVGVVTVEGDWGNPEFRDMLINFLTLLSNCTVNSSNQTKTEEEK